MKKIEISCNRKVRDYVFSQMKSLTGLSVGQAYELLKKEGSLPGVELSDLMKQAKKLKKLVDDFKFPASVPVRPIDERHLWQFRERWIKYLQEMFEKITNMCKPIYLVDEVNKQLRRRKSPILCTRVHIMWYLDLYGEENMTPEAVAKAIVKFGVKDWSQVQPLKENAKYTLNLTDETEINKEEFERQVEFIWALPKSKVHLHLAEMIHNDIQVLEDFRKLWESAPTTYNYKKVFFEYVSRLQTLPPFKKRVSLAKEKKKLSPKEQLALVRKHECPLCGNPLIQKVSQTTGKQYLAHESGSGCHYIAWGTFAEPSIHDDYNMPITRESDIP